MLKSIPQKLLLAACLAAPLLADGATRTPEEAQAVAADFFKSEAVSRLANKDALTLVHVVNNGSLNPVSYVFNANDGKGFVIVSAETEAIPVIGYSKENIFDAALVPGAVETLLSTPVFDGYEAVTRNLTRSEQRDLNTVTWSQEAPFNGNIPNRRLVGCVGVALAEIMKFHNYPAQRPASLAGAEGAAYDWENMRADNYRSEYTAEEADAVATLVADAAIAIGTDFGMSSSSAFEVKVPGALISLFGYDAGVSYKKLSEISQEQWVDILKNEIDEERPVLFSGQDVSAGHAFVCDGYQIDDNGTLRLRFNWGWGGSANGYYLPGALNPVVSKSHSYNNLQTIVYNIKPATNTITWSPIHLTNDENQVGLTLNTTDITSADSFTVRAGALKNITNTDFAGQLSIALFDESGNQKALLNDGRNFNLIALQTSKYVDFTGKVPAGVSVASGDVVRLVTRAGADATWLPVAGDLLVAGEARAINGTLPYFAIEMPGEAEAYEITCDDTRVIKGRDYTFKVVSTDPANVVTVKANGFILTPDASGNYKITNVLADQTITINVQNEADVVSKRVLWLEAGNLQNLLDDNETSTVKELTLFGTMNVNDFTFIRERMKLTYLDISQVTITANGSNPANAIPAKALQGVRTLKTIILPKNLTTLKNGCLSLTGITEIEIPASVATFEYNIFVSCRSLQTVTLRRATPAWINWCVFEGTPKNNLIVPPGATAAYQAKQYWQDFKNITEEAAPEITTFKVNMSDKRGLNITTLTEGTEFEAGSQYRFKVDADPSIGDAILEVYANNERLYPDAQGEYAHQIKGNTLFHVELRQPEATTPDTTWKITGADGGVGLVTEVVNVPVGRSFIVRANAIKVPTGADCNKFYGLVLTDKEGAIKEFITPVYTNTAMTTGNLTLNFTCKVNEASVKEGNEIRLATSYNKKVWNLVGADADSVCDRLSALGNRVVYHSINMPESITGAKIEGAATQIVHGMPFNLKVTPNSPLQRATVAVNGVNKVVNAAIANISIPVVTEDLDIAIQINDADATDYVVVNVTENTLASRIAECPERLKVVGTILSYEFDAFRAHAGQIIDLDLSDLTIKGALTAKNAIPENAFAPKEAAGSSALRTVILPNNLERIFNNAFARCMALTEITIPKNVEYVGSGAFSTCVALKKITVERETPPMTGNMTPFPSNASSITLIVPNGCSQDYSNATYWNTLAQPTEPKQSYWVKYDPSRIGLYSKGIDPNNIQVGRFAVDVWFSLPNNQSPWQIKPTDNMRPGVAFKLYDNGVDIMASLAGSNSPYDIDPIQSYTQVGGTYHIKMIPGQTGNIYEPCNHELEVVFYYTIDVEYLEGSQGIGIQFIGTPPANVWNRANLRWFRYPNEIVKSVYKENADYVFRLNNVPAGISPVVTLEEYICVEPGQNAKFETVETVLQPNADGLYTIAKLSGDTKVKISGNLHVEEGDAIASDQLDAVDKEEVAEFTELTLTGELTEESFESVREKFEAVETIDLSGIENTALPDNAFAGLENLRTVVLPETVSEIGVDAFRDCKNLESVTIPGVTTIGEGAFYGCDNLTSLIIPAAGSEPATRAGEAGITADSFKGLNPNCLIYMADLNIPDSDHLNIIINGNGTRVAASDIVIDTNYPFNAPASFNLGSHRISYTAHIPGSDEAGLNGGWTGIVLPFTPTGMTVDVPVGEREGAGLHLLSFDESGEAVELTHQDNIVANRPYLAHFVAPYLSVPVTFYAETNNDPDNYDLPFSPVPEETCAKGKEFTLYGSLDGNAVLGSIYALNEDASKFVAGEEATLGAFAAYLVPNAGVTKTELAIGNHPVWVNEPAGAGISGANLYRGDKVELACSTKGAVIYYTLDGSDPSDANSSRMIYSAPLDMDGDELIVNAMATFADYASDNVTLNFHLKRVDMDFNLNENWTWISHNRERAAAVSDFAGENVSRILSQTQEVVRDPKLGLTGSLTELLPAVGYKVCVAPGSSISSKIAGVAFNPTKLVKLNAGWNWIGSPVDDASLLITDLLANLELEEGEMIVGLEGFSEVDSYGEWQGTLAELKPGIGYMFYSKSAKEFTYNLVQPNPAPAAAPAAATRGGDETPWEVDIHKYASVMPVTATMINADGFDVNVKDVKVAAFCGSECRGIGVVVGHVMMFNVHGNAGDNIVFHFINSDNEEMITSSVISFQELPVGSIAEPYVITLDAVSSVGSILADGCEIITENGSIVVKGELAAGAAVEVYDLAGNRLGASSAVNGVITVEGLEPGVRLIVIRNGDHTVYSKILVK